MCFNSERAGSISRMPNSDCRSTFGQLLHLTTPRPISPWVTKLLTGSSRRSEQGESDQSQCLNQQKIAKQKTHSPSRSPKCHMQCHTSKPVMTEAQTASARTTLAALAPPAGVVLLFHVVPTATGCSRVPFHTPSPGQGALASSDTRVPTHVPYGGANRYRPTAWYQTYSPLSQTEWASSDCSHPHLPVCGVGK